MKYDLGLERKDTSTLTTIIEADTLGDALAQLALFVLINDHDDIAAIAIRERVVLKAKA